LKTLLSILFALILVLDLPGQDDTASVQILPDSSYLIQNVVRSGENLPEVTIKEVTIIGRPTRESSRRSEYRKYERLIYNLKKVYPYALVVRQKLEEVNAEMSRLPGDKSRREYIKQFEKNIFGQYEGEIRKMTITQGRLLIKLIDRETMNTSYDLIRQYRGGFSAAFWQGIARIFGTNLKDEYDPYGEDALIEILLWEIESGQL
jgi:hypothetical protein